MMNDSTRTRTEVIRPLLFLLALTLVLSFSGKSSAHGAGKQGKNSPLEVYISTGPSLSGHWLQTQQESYQSDPSFGIAGVLGAGAQLSLRVHSGLALAPSLTFPAGLERANGQLFSSPGLFSLAGLWLTRIDLCVHLGIRAGVGPQWTQVISTDSELGNHSLFGIGGQFDLFYLPFGVHPKKYHPEIGVRVLGSRTLAGGESTVTGVTSLGGVIFAGFTWGHLSEATLKKEADKKAPNKQ